jgi:hemoglobin
MTEDSEPTLYDRIGGDEAVARLLVAFYERVLADPDLRGFFVDVPIEKLRRMQREFFAEALGGPVRYSGRPLAAVHAKLGIRSRHLRRFLEHLLATLSDEALDEDDRYEVYTRIARRADEITGTTTVDG